MELEPENLVGQNKQFLDPKSPKSSTFCYGITEIKTSRSILRSVLDMKKEWEDKFLLFRKNSFKGAYVWILKRKLFNHCSESTYYERLGSSYKYTKGLFLSMILQVDKATKLFLVV